MKEENKLFKRKQILTEAQAVAEVNRSLESFGLKPINLPLWKRSIRDLIEKEGDAGATNEESSAQDGEKPRKNRRATWLYDGAQLWRWSEYIAKRQVLIELGHWNRLRPYSLEDLDSLVNVGTLDGEIDHPVFTPKS